MMNLSTPAGCAPQQKCCRRETTPDQVSTRNGRFSERGCVDKWDEAPKLGEAEGLLYSGEATIAGV